jgi:hypothetical protein
MRMTPRYGYDIAAHGPGGEGALLKFGPPQWQVLQFALARADNVGFLPLLPAVRTLRLRQFIEGPGSRSYQPGERDLNLDRVKAREDGGIDVGILRAGQGAVMFSEVPPGEEYGIPVGAPPKRRDQRPHPSVRLSAQERETYLQLPPTVPRRVHDFARDVVRTTNAAASDYIRGQRLAVAVQNRGTYTLHPPTIPSGRDAVDYFLFESKRGYCTYFASALTVLCRAVGIPARVVSGFANPEYQRGSPTALLREANAHAWTEIWVPNWGWATLDATPPDDRGDNSPSWWENWTDLLNSVIAGPWLWVQGHKTWAVTLLLFSLGMVMIGVASRRGVGGWSVQGFRLVQPEMSDDRVRKAIFHFYGRATRTLARRFRKRAPWETPYEWLDTAEAILELHDPRPLRQLTALYVQAKYSPSALGRAEGDAASAAFANLSWQRRPKDTGQPVATETT